MPNYVKHCRTFLRHPLQLTIFHQPCKALFTHTQHMANIHKPYQPFPRLPPWLVMLN